MRSCNEAFIDRPGDGLFSRYYVYFDIVALERGRVVARGRPDEVITDRLLREVYGVEIKVRSIPPGVFALPQTAGPSAGADVGAG